MSPKNPRNSDSIRAASCFVVLANPNASEASPSPVSPASVRTRTMSHTVRSVARTGKRSNPVTRNRGNASSVRGAQNRAGGEPGARYQECAPADRAISLHRHPRTARV